ncbi:Domain present in PSD-95 [Mactra antiquata]
MSSTVVVHSDVSTVNEPVEESVVQQNFREADLFVFENCSKGIGIKICGGCSLDGEILHGVFVRRIIPGGLAETQGGLQRGDQILEVNGSSLEGVTNDRAVSILRLACASNHVEIVACRDDEAKAEFAEIMEKSADTSRKTSTTKSENGATSSHHENGDDVQEVTGTPEALDQIAEASSNDTVTSKPAFKHFIPSMSSTPHNKGSTVTAGTGSTGSRLSSVPQVDQSVITGQLMSITNDSVFETPHTLPKKSSSKSQLTRKLSIDPFVRLKVGKLNAALRYLGLDPTPEKEYLMRSKLNIDSRETVHYGDFVEVVRDVFKLELEQKNIGTNSMMFAANDITDLVDQSSYKTDANCGASGVSQHHLEVEIERLRLENARLQEILNKKEDEILRIRVEAQGAMQEERKLRSKVHLAAKAQKVARDMEHDYEEVVRLLEGEIAQLKLQLTEQVESDPIMQRRLAVLTCQLRKEVSEKEMFKVATEKLLQFAENVHQVLNDGNGAVSSRPLIRKSSTGKKQSTQVKAVSAEAKDIVKSVRSLMDTQPLPFGWEETYTADGVKYYINHLNQVTTWTHPLSNVTRLPSSDDDKKGDPPPPPPTLQPEG